MESINIGVLRKEHLALARVRSYASRGLPFVALKSEDDQASADCSRELSRTQVVFWKIHHRYVVEANFGLAPTFKLVREAISET